MKFVHEPGFFIGSYKMKRRELTPEDKEWLRRWRERRDAELRRRFPQYFRD